MFRKTKKLATGLTLSVANGLPYNLLSPTTLEVSSDDVAEARIYIDKFWEKLQRYNPTDTDNLVGLPNTYLVPAYEKSHEFDFNELYYWDSYFMVQALLDEDHKLLVIGILEDIICLFKRFKIIPNASRTYLTGRSQPPLLTSFIFDVYDAYNLDRKWLTKMMAVAEDEYATVWMGTVKPNARKVYSGLSRYYDINYINDLAEAESGWDMTNRFNRKCLNYLPVDLNSLLYKYETDFARFHKIIGEDKVAEQWDIAAAKRKQTMKLLMWSKSQDVYLDYDFINEKKGTILSLATFYPMWAGMVDDDQAKLLVKALRKFEQKGGLATTNYSPQLNKFVRGNVPTQWAYPNGWAPLQYLTVKGLRRYGYDKDAERIAMKWLKTNLDWFNNHGVFLEKYNVVFPAKPPAKGLYPSLPGFGWTNAVFERFCQDFIDQPNDVGVDRKTATTH